MDIIMAKTSEGRSIEASRLVMNTAAIGRAIGTTLLGKRSIIADYHPGRITTSGRGAPGAAKARVKRKIKNKAARKARKNR